MTTSVFPIPNQIAHFPRQIGRTKISNTKNLFDERRDDLAAAAMNLAGNAPLPRGHQLKRKNK